MTDCEAKGRVIRGSEKGAWVGGLVQFTGRNFEVRGLGKGVAVGERVFWGLVPFHSSCIGIGSGFLLLVGGGLNFAGFLEFLDLPARLSREFRSSEVTMKAHIWGCPLENKI